MAFWLKINNSIYLCENKRVKTESGQTKIKREYLFKAGHIDSLNDTILDKLQDLKQFVKDKR